MKFAFIAKRRGIWPAGLVVRGARCLAGWLLCLADATAQSAQPGATKSLSAKVRASFLASDRTYGAQARVARPAGGRDVVRPAPDRAVDAASRLLRARPRRRRLPPDPGERPTSAIAPNVLDRTFEAACSQPQMDR